MEYREKNKKLTWARLFMDWWDPQVCERKRYLSIPIVKQCSVVSTYLKAPIHTKTKNPEQSNDYSCNVYIQSVF